MTDRHVPTPEVTDDVHRSQVPPPEPGYGPKPTAQGVRGYRDLTDDEVALINTIKELQEHLAVVWASVYMREETDHRWADIAKGHLEEGVSALVRSIAKPHDPFAASLRRLGQDAMQRLGQRLAAQAREQHGGLEEPCTCHGSARSPHRRGEHQRWQASDPFSGGTESTVGDQESSSGSTTPDEGVAQQSQDLLPDRPQTIGDSIRRFGWGGEPR